MLVQVRGQDVVQDKNNPLKGDNNEQPVFQV